MKAIIMHYSPGPFEYNPEALMSPDSTDKVKLGVNAKLKCTPGVDRFGLQLDLFILNGDKNVLNVGMLFAFFASDFGKTIEEDPTLKNHFQDLVDICSKAWYAALGVVAAKTVLSPDEFTAISDSALIRNGFILPPISAESLAQDIDIVSKPSED